MESLHGSGTDGGKIMESIDRSGTGGGTSF